MFSPSALAGKRILVVEDEAFFAFYIGDTIHDAGGTVVGPFPSVVESLAALENPDVRVDAATLDIRLREDLCFPIADRLSGTGTPFVFVSGTLEELPPPYNSRPALQKPVAAYQIIEALVGLTREIVTD